MPLALRNCNCLSQDHRLKYNEGGFILSGDGDFEVVTQSIDTHPAVEELQLSLLRQATFARRFAIMRSLSQTTIQLSRRAIQRANPTFSQLELNLAFVAYHYGPDLASRLRHYLEQRIDEPG